MWKSGHLSPHVKPIMSTPQLPRTLRQFLDYRPTNNAFPTVINTMVLALVLAEPISTKLFETFAWG